MRLVFDTIAHSSAGASSHTVYFPAVNAARLPLGGRMSVERHSDNRKKCQIVARTSDTIQTVHPAHFVLEQYAAIAATRGIAFVLASALDTC